ncbi:MAG: histidinol dehydrogenase [Pseudomonadota bacterium]
MKKIVWSKLSPDAQKEALRRPAQRLGAAFQAQVENIVNRVRADGDSALLALTKELDDVNLESLQVSSAEREEAVAALSPAEHEALTIARANLQRFHQAQVPGEPLAIDTQPGVRCERIRRPIEAVGLYVPAGSAPLPSTVLMLGVPSAIAGCPVRVLCAPPQADGRMAPSIIAAAALCGIDLLFKVGGAQAIAAMAFGTETIPSTDKLYGPGNAWVTAAKRMVSTDDAGAAIDMPAGPSEVLVIADAQADPAFVASDLLSQAEHGPDSQALLVTPSTTLADAVADAVGQQLQVLTRAAITGQAIEHARLIVVDDLAEAVQVSNQYAPEHLIIQTAQPRALLPQITAAGSVFLGAWSPEAVGDYCSGTNHVLPTYGHARAWSGLSVDAFSKSVTVQELTAQGLRALAPTVLTMTKMEGLDAHGWAVRHRLNRLGPAQ